MRPAHLLKVADGFLQAAVDLCRDDGLGKQVDGAQVDGITDIVKIPVAGDDDDADFLIGGHEFLCQVQAGDNGNIDIGDDDLGAVELIEFPGCLAVAGFAGQVQAELLPVDDIAHIVADGHIVIDQHYINHIVSPC